MTGGPTDGDVRAEPAPPGTPQRQQRFTRGQITVASVAGVALAAAIGALLYYLSGRDRRRYEALLETTLDKLVTAQEGFFYDSARYAKSFKSLPSFQLPSRVHLQMTAIDPAHSWSGTATHDGLAGRKCLVWVGSAPGSFPEEARVPENETKPLCSDDVTARR